MTEKRFLAEKANKLPIYKCYITSGWRENGEAQAIVARRRGNGKLCAASFLVDLWCTGVKDAYGDVNMTDEELNRIISYLPEVEEIDYPTAHNIIYGAVEFAGEAGIEPADEYWKWQPVLAEDNDDVPLVDIEFGRDGKYVLMAARGTREALLVPELIKRLGNDFRYVLGDPDQEDFDLPEDLSEEDWNKFKSNLQEMMDEDNRLPHEEFHHDYPEYPAEAAGKHPFIAEVLLDPDNLSSLPEGFVDQVQALPVEEAVDDISRVALYSIGHTYKDLQDAKGDDYPIEIEDGSILHALVLLTLLKDERGLETVLEIASQTESFTDFHLCDFSEELISEAVYATGQHRLDRLFRFLEEPGHPSPNRAYILEALAMTANLHPERRAEVIEGLRHLMKGMVTRLPERDGCDATFAGFIMANICDLKATELLPEAKALFDTNCVNRSIAGDYEEVSKWVNDPMEEPKDFDEPTPLGVYEFLKD